MVGVASSWTFMKKCEDEAIDFIESLTENNAHQYALNQNDKLMGLRKGGIDDVKSIEIEILIDKVDNLRESVLVLMSKSW